MKDGLIAHSRLKRHVQDRPEVLARHYLTSFPDAQAILALIANPEPHGSQTYNTNRRKIQRHYQALKAAHLHDLGLKLEWKQKSPP